MALFASASSSQVPSGNYEVFISFRGSDVRFGFLSHLKNELRRKNIDVYVDDRLKRGEEISLALVEAIEGSMIALVIFSKDYASSKWCLEELVKIIECMEAGQQIVIPIFYDVDPSDVRHQRGTYEKAFTYHEQKFKDNMQKLQIWRSVLKKTANLSGCHSSHFRDEYELVNAIVEEVLRKVERNDPIVPKSKLIGFHQNFISVESLMEIESLEVRILGIWGPGGIGKTTLASAIFDKFSSKFQSHCFLKNVREESTKIDGLSLLHQKLLSELLDQKDHINMNRAVRRLKQKKVLIVLDDVDNPKQLKDLVGQQLYLGRGSRVIATSRNRHVLKSGGIHEKYIHEVKELSLEESLELFSMHAFNQNHPIKEYEELSNLTVALAGGIPLALEVIGSHFYSRDEAYWKSELSKLQKYPHQDIQNRLKVSYDGLDNMDKQIFLDIAFFFVGEQKDQVIPVLEACGFKAVSGIQNLIDKALIKSDGYHPIVMHDLIREMAEQIVHEECVKHPEFRSRLNDEDEIYDVLKNNKGTDEIEGISLDVSRIKYLHLRANPFLKMKKLRILKVFNRHWSETKTCIVLPFDLNSFPNALKYFRWDHYPCESLPSGFCPESLAELRMIGSNVTKLWDGVQDLVNLRTIDLSWSFKLMELPDLSMAHNLENVYLYDCVSLRSVHPSILSRHTLVDLDVSGCDKLESLESETPLDSLSDLRIDRCGLKKLCLSSKKLETIFVDNETRLEILHLPVGYFTELIELTIIDGERLRSLPIKELCCLTNLEEFHVNNFKQKIHTEELYSLFDAWRNLRILHLDGWSYLSEIPGNIKCLTRLFSLSLSYSGLETLPASVSQLSTVKAIHLRECKRLKSILGLPPMLQYLDAIDCTLLETVFSDSLVSNPCRFDFKNCVKLDECSLGFIEELIQSSYTSSPARSPWLSLKACYAGNRVPKWMKYKQMTEASNTVQFTCNLERANDLLFCYVVPRCHLRSLGQVHFYFYLTCYFTCDDGDVEFYRFLECPEYDSDHVKVWPMEVPSRARTGADVKISCEFFLEWRDDGQALWAPFHRRRNFDHKVPVEACAVHVICDSESEPGSGQKRKRVADIGDEDVVPPTKRLNNSWISQPTPLRLALQLGLLHL